MNNNTYRIAMVGHKRIPSREGGVEIVVEELSTRLVNDGNKVTCYNRKGHHISGKEFDNTKFKEYKGIRIKSVPTIPFKGLAAVSSSLIGALRTAVGNYDIVHFHAEGPCAFMWIPKLFGKKCIATIHGIDWKREKWEGSFGKNFIHYGEKIAVKYADEIIVLSKSVQDYFMKEYNRKTTFIPNGVNKPVIREPNEIAEKWNLTKDSYILFLGRIVPEKGLRYLIHAYKQMDTEKKLVIAGGSSDSQEFANEIKELAKDNDNIIFTDFIEGNTLDELYSNAYVYVLPSDLEGMPLSLLEAMSYGNCCVVSDIPECKDVVGKYGITVNKSDVNDLRDTLQNLCDHPEIVQSYKTDVAEYVLQTYGWDSVLEQTYHVYKDSLK